MTSTRDGWEPDDGSRAADSAECLLVVGGYVRNAALLDRVVDEVKDRIEMSPSMVDFFEVRFVDMGARPDRSTGVVAGVARLALEFTSRPGDVARNFSALIVIDHSAAVIDRVFRACRTDPVLSELKVRSLGLARKDDRQPTMSPPPALPGDGVEIAISREGKLTRDDLVADIYRHAEFLLHDFGSGGEEGVTGRRLNEIASAAEPTLRRVIAAATEADNEAALKARAAEATRQAELRRQAEFCREAECLRDEAELRRHAKMRRRAEEGGLAEGQQQAQDQSVGIGTGRDGTPHAADKPGDAPGGDSGQSPPKTGQAPQGQPSASVEDSWQPGLRGRGARLLESSASQVVRRLRGVLASRDVGGLGAADVEEMLHECVGRLRAGDSKGAKARISALRAYADGEISAEERRHYRVIVIEGHLLQPGLPLGTLDVAFYDMVLRLAFGQPLDYPGYCDVENCLTRFGEHGQLPYRRPVLEAIDRGGASDARVLALTGYHLRPGRLDEWLRFREVDLQRLVTALAAGEWGIPAHADITFKVIHLYLGSLGPRDDRRDVLRALRANGYLVAALYERWPDSVATQVTELTAFLQSAYPHGLDAMAVADVFASSEPTPALARAALRTLAAPGLAPLVIRTFMRKLGEDTNPPQEAKLLKILTTDPKA